MLWGAGRDMRSLGKSVLLCLILASAWSPAFAATAAVPEQLDSDTIIDIAAHFSDFFVQVGPVGLWERIEVCYNKAEMASDTNGMRNCIVMDEAAKALDDNYVRAMAGSVRNRPWYQDEMFRARMMKYSEET